MMTEETIQGLSTLAAQVSAEHAASLAAIAARDAAEAKVLDAVVAAVRPALRAVASRIPTSGKHYWVTSTETDEDASYSDAHGLLVAGHSKPERDHPRANAGAFEGAALYLLPDGTWLELTFDGRWTKWQGATTEWTSTPATLTTAEVVDQYSFESIVPRIQEAVTKAAGSREKATRAALERAEKLGAIAALLK